MKSICSCHPWRSLSSCIIKAMIDHVFFRDCALHEVFCEFDAMERIEQPGHCTVAGEIVKKKKDLYAAFSVSNPFQGLLPKNSMA